jgi:hypothetical protein
LPLEALTRDGNLLDDADAGRETDFLLEVKL